MPTTLCHRFGPGRLPFAEKRDVGAGIAMAATGVLAAVVWYLGAGLLLVADLVGPIRSDLVFVMIGGALVAPFAIAGAFVVGTLAWRRYAPAEPRPRRGALLGVGTAVASLVVGSLGGAVVYLCVLVVGASPALQPDLLLILPLFVGISLGFGVPLVAWVVLPLAAFGGWYHERARRRDAGTAAPSRAAN